MRSRTSPARSAGELRRALATAVLLPLGLAVAACGGEEEAADQPADAPSSSAPADGPTGTPDPDATASPAPETSGPASAPADRQGAGDATAAGLAAIRTAERHVGGTAYAIDGSDDGTWEVDVAVGRRSVEVEVSANGRQVRGTDGDDLDADDRRALDRARTSLSRAITATIGRHGGVLDEAGLDDDDDRYHWSVSLRNGDEHDVDLTRTR